MICDSKTQDLRTSSRYCDNKTARLAPTLRYCGIDEAGRGPVIGDLVIAGILCEPNEIGMLSEIGVRDSKKLSSSRRSKIYRELVSKFKYRVIRIPPKVIDKSREKITINELEGRKFAEIINMLKPGRAYIDCADVKPENFRRHISKKLKHRCKLIIKHEADSRYPIVSAASILAKVERDRGIDELANKYGNIGSGYPSDARTIEFIENWYRENKSLPDFVRKSWKTSLRAMNSKMEK